MRAMQVTEPGRPPEASDIPRPVPGPGEVLLRVHACGLNFADTLMIDGSYQEKPPLPFVPGMEVCGTVESTGSGVEALPPGTRVACFCGAGGLAEYVAAPAAGCVAVPDTMSNEQAAGFLVAYGTSHIALAWRAELQPGETLAVLGASGGVGLTAVELGALMGARVIAIASSPEKRQTALDAGAAHAIDSRGDIRTELKALGGVDVLYDPVGGAPFDAALRACKPFARILPLGFASGAIPQIPANIVLVKNLTVLGFYLGAYANRHPEVMRRSLATLFAWHKTGRLAPHVSHILPFDQSNAGLDLLRERKAAGKAVIEIAP